MMWQIFTAFGVMCGYMAGVIFDQTLGLEGFSDLHGANDTLMNGTVGCYPLLDPNYSPNSTSTNQNTDFHPDLSNSWRCVSISDYQSLSYKFGPSFILTLIQKKELWITNLRIIFRAGIGD